MTNRTPRGSQPQTRRPARLLSADRIQPPRPLLLPALLLGALLLNLGARPIHAAEPIAVRAQALQDLLVEHEYSVPATVEALNRSRLSAEINARVEAIRVRVGDPVARGERLLDLDCRMPRSALAAAVAAEDEARARREFARRQVARAVDLQKQRNISDELLQQRQSELDVILAQARSLAEARRQAEIQVDRCGVSAPYDAWVIERHVGVGELASPGLALLELIQRGATEVAASVRDGDTDSLRQAAAPVFVYQGRRLDLRLRRLPEVVDGVAGVREARLEFTGVSAAPGAAGQLRWQRPGRWIRTEYLLQRDDRLGIFVIDDERARFEVLEAAVEGQPAAVALPAKTLVITEGRQGLNDGDAVRIEPARP